MSNDRVAMKEDFWYAKYNARLNTSMPHAKILETEVQWRHGKAEMLNIEANMDYLNIIDPEPESWGSKSKSKLW